MLKQLSVFLENREGMLLEATKCLAKSKIDIRALSLADTADYGILRLVVDRPDEAVSCLREAGMTAKLTNVIAVRLADDPGSLNAVLAELGRQEIGAEYAYAFLEHGADAACVILRVRECERAEAALIAAGLSLLGPQDIAAI